MSDDLVIRYRDLQGFIGGCHDGYCVIKKPQGMHTNGGCNCLEDMKLHERSRVGGLLKYGQEMADRIEELEAKLAKAMQVVEMIASADVDAVLGQAVDISCEIIGELMEDEDQEALSRTIQTT